MSIKETLKLFFSILICELAGVIGAFTMSSFSREWYATLAKPAFTPPSWVFAPIWIVLYALMGIAIFFVWRDRTSSIYSWRKYAFGIFDLQLILNAVWSPIFFGLQRIDLALVIIVALWFVIIWTITVFYRVSKLAAYLLVPYLIWVTMAIYLNASIWVLNS